MSSGTAGSSPPLRDELRNIVREARWVFATISPEQKRTLRSALGLMAIAAIANAIGPLFIGFTIDAVLRRRILSLSAAVPYLLVLAALYVFRELVTVRRKIVVERAATDIEKTALLKVVGTMFRADLASLDEERVGTMHNRLRRSVDGLVRYVKLGFLDFLPAVANATFAMIAAIYRQYVVGLFMILIVPVGGYIVIRQLASQRGVRLRLLRTKELMDGTVIEQLSGMETVRAANTVTRELQRTAAVAEELRADEMLHHKAMATFDAWKSLNEGFFHIALLAVAIGMNVRGYISAGEVLTFSMLYLATVTPLREIHRILDEAHESSLLVANMREILSDPWDISFSTADSGEDCSVGEIIVAAHDVSAGYREGSSTKAVLRDVSFSIRRGEIVGIAGASGSGKSTLLRLVLRLTHLQRGNIVVAGTAIKDLSREAIARTFAFVSQTPFLFAGTIFENIAYECPTASEAEVRAAARLAQVAQDIERMSGGYRARVKEHGQNLSGGQRQRIALARAFLKDAPVLILDEATSALDNVSESGVLDALRRPDRSVLMVAHRTTSLRYADRILVFDRGMLVESGTFSELAARDGAFSLLLRAASTDRPAPLPSRT